AGVGTPDAGARVAAPHLEHLRLGREQRGDPVEAVSAKIYQSYTSGESGFEGVEHRLRPVLRVRAGGDGSGPREELDSLEVQVFVREDVVAEACPVEPLEQLDVGRKLVRTAQQERHPVVGAHVDDRPQARGVGDAASIAVRLVYRVHTTVGGVSVA